MIYVLASYVLFRFFVFCFRISRTAAFREDLSHALALTLEESVPDGKAAGVAGGGDAGAGWNEGFLSRVLAFGPRNVGANILARWGMHA